MKGSRTLVLAAGALAAAGLLAVSGVAATDGPGGTPAPASFRLADGSAGCTYLSSGDLACRSLDEPAALVLEPGGDSHADDDLALDWDERTPVLLAAESWWHGGYSCRAHGGGIRCATAAGAAIAVST